MTYLTSNATFDHATFGHAWRAPVAPLDPGGTFAVVNLGQSYFRLSSVQEAAELAAVFMEAAAALARLEADPALEALGADELAGVGQAAAAAVADVLKAAS